MDLYWIVLAIVLGLIFGSFGSVVAHRVPRGESIGGRERSKCPSCGNVLGAKENVPLLSFAFQGGRCAHCKARIPLRYPLAELATGVLFGLSVWKFDMGLPAVVYAAFFWVLVVLTVVDLEHHLLPDKIVFPSLVVGLLGLAA
ncbi:MAG: prepilin peptidase, partial [Actinomycetota bacterium]|nr:prepilin peptidase [Actinomycetota bacterium]